MSTTAQQFVSNVDFQQYALPTEEHKNAFGQDITGSGFASKFMNFATGVDHEQDYQNMLTNKDREFELAKINDARAYDTWFDSTKYQRMVSDLKQAGISPWLVVNGNASSAGSSSVGTSTTSRSRLAEKQNKSGTLAALVVAAAKLLSVLLV